MKNLRQIARWALRLLLVGAFAVQIFAEPVEPQVTGYTATISNEGTRVAGGTSIPALGIAFICLAILYLLFDSGKPRLTDQVAGLWRRFASFVVDFITGMITVSSVIAFIALGLEAARTGHFAWQFERDYATRTDIIAAPLSVGLGFISIFAYFAFPILKRRQTIGEFATRTAVALPESARNPYRITILRTLLAFVGLSAWFIAPFLRDKQKNPWWDQVFNTRVYLEEK